MNDCPNADVRDVLPDLLHGRLDEATRAMVEAHVAGCADCRAELALLGDVRTSTMRRAPTLNLAAIGAAVPAYCAPARRSWVGWRTAAAVTLIVAGGSSIIVTQRIGTRQPDSTVVATQPASPAPPAASGPAVSSSADVTPPGSVPSIEVPTPVPSEAKVAPQTLAPADRELAMAGGTLTDLSDRELTSLLKEIESLDAVPSTDVENVSISPIAPRKGTP